MPKKDRNLRNVVKIATNLSEQRALWEPLVSYDPVARYYVRMVAAIVIGAFVALVAANFAYIYPILTDELLPYPKWLSRMWFRSWI